MTRHWILWGVAAALAAIGSRADIVIDYGINGNIANTAPSPITLPIDLDGSGVATINPSYVTGVNTAPVVGVTGDFGLVGNATFDVIAESSNNSTPPDFTASSQFRVAGIGGLGVGNNYTDDGESIRFSVDLTGLPAGYVVRATYISFEDPRTDPQALVYGNDGGFLAATGFAEGDMIDVTGLGTGVPTGSSGVLLTVYGGPNNTEWKFDDLGLQIAVIPEPSTLSLLVLAGLVGLRRRRR